MLCSHTSVSVFTGVRVCVNAFGISSLSSGLNVDFHLCDTQTLARLYWLVSHFRKPEAVSVGWISKKKKSSLAIHDSYFGEWCDELINSTKWKRNVLRFFFLRCCSERHGKSLRGITNNMHTMQGWHCVRKAEPELKLNIVVVNIKIDYRRRKTCSFCSGLISFILENDWALRGFVFASVCVFVLESHHPSNNI